MKKILSFMFICTFIFVLTGCGKGNTLTCTKGNEKIVVTYGSEKPKKIEMTEAFNTKEDAIEYEELLNSNPSKEVTAKRNNNKITITITGETLKSEKLYATKETAKKYAEEEGFKCK